jgi:CRP/FNR family transcriptional regulator, cyclic AMP receptor protein
LKSYHSTWKLPAELYGELQKDAPIRHLKTGETLFEIGDEGDGCYRVDKGAVKVSLKSEQADERIIALLGTDSIVGDLSMIDGKPRSATVVALTPCDLTFFNRKRFEKFTEKHPELYRDLVNMLADRLRDCDEGIAALAFLPMKNRVARALLQLTECLGEDAPGGKALLPRRITQRDVAALAGVARETANRILHEWKRNGMVIKRDENYEIDKIKLTREINERGKMGCSQTRLAKDRRSAMSPHRTAN